MANTKVLSSFSKVELWIRLFVLSFSYLWIAAVRGDASFGWSERFLANVNPIQLFGRLILFAFAIHIVIVWPLTQMSKQELSKIKSCTWRRFILATLIGLPLLSFGFYLGDFRVSFEYTELFLSVIPSVVIGVILFEEMSPLAGSLFISLSVFCNFFVVNDLIGSYSTLFRWASKGEWIYLWRLLTPLFAIFTCAFSLRESRRVLFEESHALIVLGGCYLGFTLLYDTKAPLLFPALFILGSLLFWGVLRIRTSLGYMLSLGIGVLFLAVASIGLLFALRGFELTIERFLLITATTMSVICFISLMSQLLTRRLKIFFVLPNPTH